jgi:hypothetical protein
MILDVYCGSRIQGLDFCPSRIQGSKKRRIRNTGPYTRKGVRYPLDPLDRTQSYSIGNLYSIGYHTDNQSIFKPASKCPRPQVQFLFVFKPQGAAPPPPSCTCSEGRWEAFERENYLNYPPPPQWDRRAIQPSHI